MKLFTMILTLLISINTYSQELKSIPIDGHTNLEISKIKELMEKEIGEKVSDEIFISKSTGLRDIIKYGLDNINNVDKYLLRFDGEPKELQFGSITRTTTYICDLYVEKHNNKIEIVDCTPWGGLYPKSIKNKRIEFTELAIDQVTDNRNEKAQSHPRHDHAVALPTSVPTIDSQHSGSQR